MDTAIAPSPNGQINQAPFFKPEGCYIKELVVGDYAAFDVFYGIEEVIHINRETLPNGVICMHMHVRRRSDQTTGRFVVRASHEPITRWQPQ